MGVGKFEKNFFESGDDLLEIILLWKRYIDDVFALIKGSEEECRDLVDFLNTLMPGVVKFTFDFSEQKIQFLDLEISIVDGKLETNLFIKPTNLQLYLDYFSNHPEHCKVGIAYSQALRVIERCSRPENARYHLENLKNKLKEKNYPEHLIDEQFGRAKEKDRKSLIFKQRKGKATDDKKVRLIFTHNAKNPPLHQWLREGKKLLARNEKAKKIGEKLQIVTRQPKNLQRIVSGTNKGGGGGLPPIDAGCHKCKKCRVLCPILKEGKKFMSTNTKKIYTIRKNLDCNSTYVVYLGTCLKCKGQYVGKTSRAFKARHSGHKSEIKRQYGGLGHHYGGDNGCGYGMVSMQIIDQVEQGDDEALADCEVYWQHQLRCFVENGANGHCYRTGKKRYITG